MTEPPNENDMVTPTQVAMVILALSDCVDGLNDMRSPGHPKVTLRTFADNVTRAVELDTPEAWARLETVCEEVANLANANLLRGFAFEIFEQCKDENSDG